jgi:hypothetical protein
MGTRLQSPYNATLHVAHFYNIAQKSDVWGEEKFKMMWEDMDYFIEQQGSSHIFIGTRPATQVGICNAHNLARGVSLTAFARGRSPLDAPRGTGKKRDFKPLSVYFQVTSTLAQTQSAVSARFEQMVQLHMNRNTTTAATKQRILTPAEKLKAYTDALQEDELAIRFSVLSFETTCLKLLRLIRAMYVVENPVTYSKEFDSDERLGDFVQALLGAPDNTQLGGSSFRIACKVLGTHITSNWEQELEKAMERVHFRVDGFFDSKVEEKMQEERLREDKQNEEPDSQTEVHKPVTAVAVAVESSKEKHARRVRDTFADLYCA